jgi:hypothetical protein
MPELTKGFGPPATAGQKQRRSMLTAGNTSTTVNTGRSASPGAALCPMCDHRHGPGSQCSYQKGILDLFDISKADQPTMPGKKGGGGIPGHTGGNKHHGPDGRFTTAGKAVSVTPAKGKPAVKVPKPDEVNAGGGFSVPKPKDDFKVPKPGEVSAGGGYEVPKPNTMNAGGGFKVPKPKDETVGTVGPSPKAESKFDPNKTGAASPKAKDGGPLKGEEGGSGGVTGDGAKTKQGGEEDEAYNKVVDENKNKFLPPGSEKPIKPDDYSRAHINLTQKMGDRARSAAKQAGHSTSQVNLAAFEADQDAGHAVGLAKERGIPAHEIEQHLPQLMEEAKQARINAANQPPTVEGLFDQGQQPVSGTIFQSPTKLDAHPGIPLDGSTQTTSVGTPQGVEHNLRDPSKMGTGMSSPPASATPPTPNGPPTPKGKTPPKGKKGGSLGLPIAQMYGAGSAIGSGLAGSPGGGVAPTASFAAQRAHQLLNPNLNSTTGPALANPGSGPGGRAAWQSANASQKPIHNNFGIRKSVLDVLDD